MAHAAPQVADPLSPLLGSRSQKKDEGQKGPQGVRILCVALSPAPHHTEVSLGAGAGVRREEGRVSQFWSGPGLQKHPEQPLGQGQGEAQAEAVGERGPRAPPSGCVVKKLWAPRSGSRRVMVSISRAREGPSTYPVVQAILSVSWERVRFGIGGS